MARKKFTTTFLQSLKAAPQGKREMYWDTELPHFGVRVSDSGNVSFVIVRRLGKKQLKRTLDSFQAGKYPALDTTKEKTSGLLAKARARAREELADISNNVDPKVRQAQEQQARERERLDTFEKLAEDYVERHVKNLRSAKLTEQVIRRELIARWKKKTIKQISRRDVIEMVEAVAASGRPAVAHQALAHARSLFGWAVERDILPHSPADRISPVRLVGPLTQRDRILTDAELKALWGATAWVLGSAEGLNYPLAPFARLLLLTGLRLREAAELTWTEVDLGAGSLTIAAERMKGNEPHTLPLAPMALALLKSLPRWDGGDYVFSTQSGSNPISGFSKFRKRIGKAMGEGVKDAPEAKIDGVSEEPENWSFHDLRRTFRTHLSALPIPVLVAELLLAHKQPGLHRVYDRHRYLQEKLEALTLWEGRLRSIVEPAPANVVAIRAQAALS